MDGSPNRRDKAAFLNASGVAWKGHKMVSRKAKLA